LKRNTALKRIIFSRAKYTNKGENTKKTNATKNGPIMASKTESRRSKKKGKKIMVVFFAFSKEKKRESE
jgi:hypothetical protein